MSMNTVRTIDNLVPVRHILVSVSDKNGLESLIPELIRLCPEVKILSTGGTYKKIGDILGDKASGALMPVSEYTGQPETQGGLVKTLDFKIYLGLLTETYNDAHQCDLGRTGAVPIDMVFVNLYPFRQTIAQPDATVESARGNIDIGGPCMIRAAAKNFIRVAPVVDPVDYSLILDELRSTRGQTTLETRAMLAKKAFAHTAEYDQAITEYLRSCSIDEIRQTYPDVR
jgi:phosphoribosylaminoimidazolecarboxamide formyltransferase/IMP cyclohydrolase